MSDYCGHCWRTPPQEVSYCRACLDEAIAAEREACAKIAESYTRDGSEAASSAEIAAAIRARST